MGGIDLISFDDSLGTLPRKPSFWLDDAFFWTPIIFEESHKKDLPRDYRVLVTLGWGGDIRYNKQSHLLSIPIGVACGLYNQYVQQSDFLPSAAAAAQIEPEGFYMLWEVYHNWGIEKEPWLEKILYTSLVRYRFQSMIDFLVSSLDRTQMFAGDFLDEILRVTNSEPSISERKKSKVRDAIMDEPLAQGRARPRAEAKKKVAYKILSDLESKTRKFIKQELSKLTSKWWKERVPRDVREKAEERQKRDATKSGARLHPIHYVDFTDYMKIISHKDNWEKVFKSFFMDIVIISAKFRELYPIRNAIAHPRPLSNRQITKLRLYAVEIKGWMK